MKTPLFVIVLLLSRSILDAMFHVFASLGCKLADKLITLCNLSFIFVNHIIYSRMVSGH
ncbi:hypothetical protein RchiOBHm_Chr6g0282471 [Rosa chinensis]|uniref:Uncharacterized protein n=1 Tax=Rosa chinensis TaxID=74649 RepID=A0A2P6PTR9_ROSCH|nr:hypothetical protein RchiOBHm_Chr6g0282471 [Rosa chinensis]